MKMPLLCLALILLTNVPATADVLEDFESGDDNWTSYAWFDPDSGVSAIWTVTQDGLNSVHAYMATGYGNTLAWYTPFQSSDVGVAADMKLANISAGGAHCSVVARWNPVAHTGYEFGLVSSDHGDHTELDLMILKFWADEDRNELLAVSTPYVLSPGVDSLDWVHLELQIVGTSLQGFLNGQPALTASDTEFTSGHAGVFEANHGDWIGDYMIAWADNVRITDLSPVAAQPATWSHIKQQFMN